MIKESSDNRWASFRTPEPVQEAMTLLAAWNAECFPNQLSLPAGLGAANGKIKIKFNTMYKCGEIYYLVRRESFHYSVQQIKTQFKSNFRNLIYF